MRPGTIDLITLIILFFGLQIWWLIPFIKRNNKLNQRYQDFRDEILRLERLYKK